MTTSAATFAVVLMLSMGSVVSKDFRLSASLAKSEMKRGEPISLELVLKNISKRRIHVGRGNLLSAYRIEIKDPRGNRVMQTDLGKELLLRSMFVSGRTAIYLDPGQELRGEIEVSQIYNMMTTGTYSIIAKRSVPKSHNDGLEEVVSNEVKVKVSN